MKILGLDTINASIVIFLTTSIVWVSIPTHSTHSMPDQGLTESISVLKQKAGRGMLRVIVRVRQSSDNANTAHASSKEIESAKLNVTKIMRKVGVQVVEGLEGQPLIVMELTADQLDRLVATNLVESIQEDRINPAFK